MQVSSGLNFLSAHATACGCSIRAYACRLLVRSRTWHPAAVHVLYRTCIVPADQLKLGASSLTVSQSVHCCTRNAPSRFCTTLREQNCHALHLPCVALCYCVHAASAINVPSCCISVLDRRHANRNKLRRQQQHWTGHNTLGRSSPNCPRS